MVKMLWAATINIITLLIVNKVHVWVSCAVHSGLLVQRGHSLSGLYLIQAKREGKAACQLLNATDVRWCSVQIGSLVLEQFVEQLQDRRWKVFLHKGARKLKKTLFQACFSAEGSCMVWAYLLQAEDECLGTQDLVNLSGFTQSLLDDVTTVIVILNKNHWD